MNIPNNKKKQSSQEKIEKAFINMLQKKNIEDINVTDLVKKAEINRSTFYTNYIDIYNLADKLKDKMYNEILSLYPEETKNKTHSYNFLNLFKHIKDNQIYYNTLFKLNFDFSKLLNEYSLDSNLQKYCSNPKFAHYHITFFKAGLNAIIREWLASGCADSPEEINEVLKSEYMGKSLD